MTTQEFNSAKKETLLEGAKLCYENAKVHQITSERAAAVEHYGVANSHLILGVEECVKSLILMAGYFNLALPGPIEPYFSDHAKRHKEARQIQPFLEKLVKFSEVLKSIFSRKSQSKFGLSFDVILTWALATVLDKVFPTTPRNFDAFWKKANHNKNKGLYVDFVDGKWVTPSVITKIEYAEAFEMSNSFLSFLDFITMIQPEDYKELDFGRLIKMEEKTSTETNNK